MDDKKLGFVESKFADIIWQSEPISSGELVKRCEAIALEKTHHLPGPAAALRTGHFSK